MFKNKKTLYILLPLVVLVWGIIIYKIVDAFSEEEIPVSQLQSVSSSSLVFSSKEKFTLGPILRDPFLDISYVPKPQKPVTKKKKRANKIDWPHLQCKGLVSNAADTERIYILSIDGTDHLIQKGDHIGDLKIIGGTATKVTIRLKGETKHFFIDN